MTRVLLANPFRPEHLPRFEGLEGYEFYWSSAPSEEELKGTEIILGAPSAETLRMAGGLKWVQLAFAGSDNYASMPLFRERGILLTNLSGAFGQSISEIVLCYVLMLYKHMQQYRDHQLRHEWVDEGRQDTPVGKRLLILGAGNIGCETARLFHPFTREIIGMRRSSAGVPPCFSRIVPPQALEEELSLADIVVCALPQSAETVRLLNRERLALMKPSALLINVGRGSLIDTDALADLLKQGKLAGAALDVTDPEPLNPDHAIWDCPNAIITPHISGGSFGHLKATEEILFDLCRENLKRYAQGAPLLNRVDPETGYRVSGDRYSPA